MTRMAMVIERAAHMPSSCWGRYRKVAAVEVDVDELLRNGRLKPAMISPRARGVTRVLAVWDRLHHGRTNRCASAWGREQARALCASHNAELGDEAVAASELLAQARAEGENK